jgi:hypothetical protein
MSACVNSIVFEKIFLRALPVGFELAAMKNLAE